MASANVEEGWVELHDFAKEQGVQVACLWRGIRAGRIYPNCTVDGRMILRSEGEPWVQEQLVESSPQDVERPMGGAQASAQIGITRDALNAWWERHGAGCPIGDPEVLGTRGNKAWLTGHVAYVRDQRAKGVGVRPEPKFFPGPAPKVKWESDELARATEEDLRAAEQSRKATNKPKGTLVRSGKLRAEVEKWLADHPSVSGTELSRRAGMGDNYVWDLLSRKPHSVKSASANSLRKSMREWDREPERIGPDPKCAVPEADPAVDSGLRKVELLAGQLIPALPVIPTGDPEVDEGLRKVEANVMAHNVGHGEPGEWLSTPEAAKVIGCEYATVPHLARATAQYPEEYRWRTNAALEYHRAWCERERERMKTIRQAPKATRKRGNPVDDHRPPTPVPPIAAGSVGAADPKSDMERVPWYRRWFTRPS